MLQDGDRQNEASSSIHGEDISFNKYHHSLTPHSKCREERDDDDNHDDDDEGDDCDDNHHEDDNQ